MSTFQWAQETAGFLAYLRSRGWRYPLLVFGTELRAMHTKFPPPPANDNWGRRS